MTKPFNKLFKAWVGGKIRHLRWHFFQNHCEIDVCYVDTETPYAEITTDIAYNRIDLRLSRHMERDWLDGKHYRVFEALVHEFTHAALTPLMVLARKSECEVNRLDYNQIWERTTQTTTSIILNGIPKSITPKDDRK